MKGGRKSAALLSPSKRFESIYACRLRERSAGILGKSCGGLPSFTDMTRAPRPQATDTAGPGGGVATALPHIGYWYWVTYYAIARFRFNIG